MDIFEMLFGNSLYDTSRYGGVERGFGTSSGQMGIGLDSFQTYREANPPSFIQQTYGFPSRQEIARDRINFANYDARNMQPMSQFPLRPNYNAMGAYQENIDPRTYSAPFTDNMNEMNFYDDNVELMGTAFNEGPYAMNESDPQAQSIANYQSPTLPPMPQQAQAQGSGYYPGMYAGRAISAGRDLFSGLFGGETAPPVKPTVPFEDNQMGITGDFMDEFISDARSPQQFQQSQQGNFANLFQGLGSMFSGGALGMVEGATPGAQQAGSAAMNIGKNIGSSLLDSVKGLDPLEVAGGVMGAMGEYRADQRGVDAYRALADKAQNRAGTYLDRAESYRTGEAINSAFNQNLDTAMTNANAVNRNMLSKGIDSTSMMKENLSQATDRANIANQRTRQQFNQYADQQQNIYDTVMAQADQIDAQADMLDNKKWWEYGASAINAIVS